MKEERARFFLRFLRLHHISYLPKRITALIQEHFPLYRFDHPDYNPAASYLMNHCAHCSTKVDDMDLHHDPGATFVLMPDECDNNITLMLLPVNDPISIGCTYILSFPDPIQEARREEW